MPPPRDEIVSIKTGRTTLTIARRRDGLYYCTKCPYRAREDDLMEYHILHECEAFSQDPHRRGLCQNLPGEEPPFSFKSRPIYRRMSQGAQDARDARRLYYSGPRPPQGMSRHDRHDFRRIYGSFSPYPPRRDRSNTVPGPSVCKSTNMSPSAPSAGRGVASMEVVEPYSPVVGLRGQECPSTPLRGNRAPLVVPLTPTIYHRDRDPRLRVKTEDLPASPMKIDPATPQKEPSIQVRPEAEEPLPSTRSTVEPGEIRASEPPREQPATSLDTGKGATTLGFWARTGSDVDTDIAMTSPMATQRNTSLPPLTPDKVARMSLMQLLEAARQPSPPAVGPSIWSADCPTPRVPDAGEKLPLFFPSLSPSPGPRASATPEVNPLQKAAAAKSYEDSVAIAANLNAVYDFLDSLDKPLAHHWEKFTTAGINKEADLDVLANLPPGCEKYLDDIYKQLQEKGVSPMDWIHVVRGLQNRSTRSTGDTSPSKSTRGRLL